MRRESTRNEESTLSLSHTLSLTRRHGESVLHREVSGLTVRGHLDYHLICIAILLKGSGLVRERRERGNHDSSVVLSDGEDTDGCNGGVVESGGTALPLGYCCWNEEGLDQCCMTLYDPGITQKRRNCTWSKGRRALSFYQNPHCNGVRSVLVSSVDSNDDEAVQLGLQGLSELSSSDYGSPSYSNLPSDRSPAEEIVNRPLYVLDRE